jgi:hypothetical protein
MTERKRTPKAEVEPRAVGDDAVAAGMAKVAGGGAVRDGDDEINLTRDYIAQRAKRTGPQIDIWVQPTAPAHAVGRVWIKTA